MIDIAEGPGRDLKNIRQIGTPAEGDRIYIENAAYARVHEETYEERRVFIFMGHTECEQGVYMTFVEAAIPVRDMEFSQNLPRWGTHAWSDVFREIKRSYENSIIVGWALDCKGYPPRLTAELEAIHREQFGGAHQVLFLMDSMEGEEYFYLHKGNRLQPKNGFYIYYARELHEIRIPDVTIELPRRGTRQMLPEILTESAKSTETISEPMQLIPIEEVPAGAVKKAEEAAPSTQPAEEKEKPVAVEKAQNYYVVQQGDTLSGICKQAYGSMKKLKELEKANDLEDSDDIRVGQKLLLP